MKKALFIAVLLASATTLLFGKENVNESGKVRSDILKRSASNCQPATSQTDMNINNVRTTLLNGGDLWWNLSDARYEVPKIDPPGSAPSVHALFSGAIWLGGIDAGGQLKMAAQTYRQTGNDFWPGPLDANANVDAQTCQDYDRHWVILGADIDRAIAAYDEESGITPADDIAQSLKDYPAKGNINAKGARNVTLNIGNNDLAPFYDRDGDGLYDPTKGDYPIIKKACDDVYADQMIFWVYNDKGNIHSETGGQAIGVQVNAMAFAFSTSDEVNNMTFYTYEIKNRSTIEINNFYMGQWADPDLGCFQNDYVGVDTSRSLGIVYNGTLNDPDCGSRGYGANPPLLGIDYFEGPLDENGVQLGLSTFTYYNNTQSPIDGNPTTAVHFYNYMRGFWKDGVPFSDDGTQGSCTYRPPGNPVKYMYPGDPTSGSVAFGQKSECSCNNVPDDRRFVQASGPFILKPGFQSNITVGVVWNRPVNGSSCGSGITFEQSIGQVDDKAQALFDNCFKLVDGPDAPTVEITELDREIIIKLVNESGNNEDESYDQVDPVANSLADTDPSITDITYTFEGYILYQLRNGQVSANDLSDITKARVIAQVDKKNGIKKIINYQYDPFYDTDVPGDFVDGADNGIRTTFRIREDLFATSNSDLVNHKTYYFAAIAYAYNNYVQYNPQNPTAGGQKNPLLKGRRNYAVYSAIPHKPTASLGGTALNAEYGDGVELTRLDGKGNSFFNLELSEETVQEILNAGTGLFAPIKYAARRGPIDVKVVDPMELKSVDFEIEFVDTTQNSNQAWALDDSVKWVLKADGSIVYFGSDISNTREHYIPGYGISINFGQSQNTGNETERIRQNFGTPQLDKFGFIDASIEFEDPEKQWLSGVQDEGQFSPTNWIRSGRYKDNPMAGSEAINDDYFFSTANDSSAYDPNEHFESILGGIFAPYCLASNYQRKGLAAPYNTYPFSEGPGFPWRFRGNNANPVPAFTIPSYTLDSLQSIDLVFTPDKSKWTKCVVVELSEDRAQAQGGALKGQLRQGTSLDKEGNQILGDVGMSYFPGYAINVSTGERLNIMFGESSWLVGENGRDMVWNPTSVIRTPLNQFFFGGKHFVYVMNTKYDEGEYNKNVMDSLFNRYRCIPPGTVVNVDDCPVNRIRETTLNDSIYKKIMWVGAFTMAPGYVTKTMAEGIVPNEAKVKIRVNNSYAQFVADGSNNGINKYAFTTKGLAPDTNQTKLAENFCDQIRVVPNPYYAYSGYEITQLDTRVKITNLPPTCQISIYTIDGVLIKQYNRAVSSNTQPGLATNRRDQINIDNSLDWDLKNSKGIPISSGVYLIHVKADGLCEKVVRWFGALRPTDLDTF
jgi:hypothetical protein